MEISYYDGDNFVRNAITVKCDGRAPQVLASKVTTSDALPVSTEDVMLDLRVDSDDEEDTIRRMIRGAADFMERRTAYAILPGSYQVLLPGWWYGELEVHRGPVREVSAIEYLRGPNDWVAVDLANFYVEFGALGRSFTMRTLSTFDRPDLWSEVKRVRVSFTAGFATAAEEEADANAQMPDGLRTALIMLVGHYYKNRELFAAGAMEAVEKDAMGILGAYRQYW